MANKITILVDLVTDKATTAARGFRRSISEAEGGLNKFKAGASSAFATVQANAVGFAIAGGAAIAGFAAKSVSSFQETALAAGKFSDATGLAVEDASRLQEVASDLGISTEALSIDFKFLQKAIASNTDEVQQLGIETQRTKDGQVDVNATFLEAIDKLGGVTDANQRALIASKLFGRGFADSAELILGNADEIRQRLADVSKEQVISSAQVERARKFRDQMDQLSDNLKRVEIVTGEALIPVLGNLADVLGGVETAAEKAAEAVDKIPGGTDFLKTLFAGPQDIADEFLKHLRDLEEGLGFPERVDIGPLREKFNQMIADSNAAKDALRGTGDAASTTADEVVDLGDKSANTGAKIGDLAGAFADAEQHLADLNQQAQDNALNALAAAAQAVGDALDSAFGDLEGDLGALDLLDNIKEQFDKVAEAGQKATDPQGIRDYNREVRRLQGQLLDYLRTVDNIPPDKVTQIIAQIRNGNIEQLQTILDDLTKDRFINVTINPPKTAGFASANGLFSPTQATPIINGATTPTQSAIPSGFVDARQTTVIYPFTSPTQNFVDQQTYLRWNGER